jgi:hypothetical protein
MSKLDPTEETKVDNLVDDIYTGLERTVTSLQKELPDTVDALSAKQLRRALKAVISYPDIDPDDASNMSEAEQLFNAKLLALHQASVQLEIRAIGELQRQHDLKAEAEEKE